jgi:hypothetical protein
MTGASGPPERREVLGRGRAQAQGIIALAETKRAFSGRGLDRVIIQDGQYFRFIFFAHLSYSFPVRVTFNV